MFRSTKLAAVLLLSSVFAAAGLAAPVYVQFSITDPRYPILGAGEFTGHINTGSGYGPGFAVFCDDYQNNLSTGQYAAYISDITNLSDTRFGTTATANFAYQANNVALTAADRYTLAAWLTTQYTYPATPTADDLAIQTAIWTLMAQKGAPTVPAGANASLVTSWLNKAVAVKANTPLFNTIQADVRIVTSADVAAASTPGRYHLGQQEFIYTTPEPASIALAGLGLAALVVVRRRYQR